MIKYAIIFLLPVLGGIAKHTVFGGAGPIWPWLLLSCLVASLWDWKAALAIAAGVAAAQGLERWFSPPEIVQGALYTVIAFALLGMGRSSSAFFIAIVGAAYFAAGFSVMPWFPAVVLTEFLIVFALIGAAHGGRNKIHLGDFWHSHDTIPIAGRVHNSVSGRQGVQGDLPVSRVDMEKSR